MKKISIKDIAELSGVSIATVSRVINNNGRFSNETREKVLRVIKETGYQTNLSAKTLRMNKSFSIGIIVPDITNFFFAYLVEKIEEILFSKGFSTIICNTGRDHDKEKEYLRILESKSIDGLIIISGIEKFSYENSKIPYICIDREPIDIQKSIFISSDHYNGAVLATEHLLSNNVKNPSILLHENMSSSSKNRLAGFIDTLNKNDMSLSEHNVLKVQYNDFSCINLSQLIKKNKVDGIFVVNDNLALNLLVQLKLLNIDVPNDVKVIGFDNIPSCEYVSPQLSSIKQNIPLIAKTTVFSLLQLMDGNFFDTLNNNKIIPVDLVIRESSK